MKSRGGGSSRTTTKLRGSTKPSSLHQRTKQKKIFQTLDTQLAPSLIPQLDFQTSPSHFKHSNFHSIPTVTIDDTNTNQYDLPTHSPGQMKRRTKKHLLTPQSISTIHETHNTDNDTLTLPQHLSQSLLIKHSQHNYDVYDGLLQKHTIYYDELSQENHYVKSIHMYYRWLNKYHDKLTLASNNDKQNSDGDNISSLPSDNSHARVFLTGNLNNNHDQHMTTHKPLSTQYNLLPHNPSTAAISLEQYSMLNPNLQFSSETNLSIPQFKSHQDKTSPLTFTSLEQHHIKHGFIHTVKHLTEYRRITQDIKQLTQQYYVRRGKYQHSLNIAQEIGNLSTVHLLKRALERSSEMFDQKIRVLKEKQARIAKKMLAANVSKRYKDDTKTDESHVSLPDNDNINDTFGKNTQSDHGLMLDTTARLKTPQAILSSEISNLEDGESILPGGLFLKRRRSKTTTLQSARFPTSFSSLHTPPRHKYYANDRDNFAMELASRDGDEEDSDYELVEIEYQFHHMVANKKHLTLTSHPISRPNCSSLTSNYLKYANNTKFIQHFTPPKTISTELIKSADYIHHQSSNIQAKMLALSTKGYLDVNQSPSSHIDLHTLAKRYRWGKGRFTGKKFFKFFKKMKNMRPFKGLFATIMQRSWHKRFWKKNQYHYWGMHKSFLKSIPQVYVNFWIKWATVWQLPPIPFAIPPPPFFLLPTEYKKWFFTTWRWTLKVYYYIMKMVLKPFYYWVPRDLKKEGIAKDMAYSLPDTMLPEEKAWIVKKDGAVPTYQKPWKSLLLYHHNSQYIVPLMPGLPSRHGMTAMFLFTSLWFEVFSQWQFSLKTLNIPYDMNLSQVKVDLSKFTFSEWVHHFTFIQNQFDAFTVNQSDFSIFDSLAASVSHMDAKHLMTNIIALLIFGPKVYRFLGPLGFLVLWTLSAHGAYHFNLIAQNNEGKSWHVSVLEQVLLSQPDLFSPEEIAHVNDVIVSPSLGASGAIMGVMTALAVLFPKDKFKFFGLPIPVPLLVSSIILVEALSLENAVIDGINHSGHIGGVIGGLGALVLLWYIPLLGKHTPFLKWGTNLPIIDWITARPTSDPDKIDYRNWKPEEGYHEQLLELWRTATWRGYLHDPSKFFIGSSISSHHRPRVRYMWSSHHTNRTAWVNTRRKAELRVQLGDVIGSKLPNFLTTTRITGPIIRMHPGRRSYLPTQVEITYHTNIQRRAVQRLIYQRRTKAATILNSYSWNAFSNSRVIHEAPQPLMTKDLKELHNPSLERYYDTFGEAHYAEEFVEEQEEQKRAAKQKLLNLGLITTYNEEKYDELGKVMTPEEFIQWERRRIEQEQDEEAQQARDRFVNAVTAIQGNLLEYINKGDELSGIPGKTFKAMLKIRGATQYTIANAERYGSIALHYLVQQGALFSDYIFIKYQRLNPKIKSFVPFMGYLTMRRRTRNVERLEAELSQNNPFVHDKDVEAIRKQTMASSLTPSQFQQTINNKYAIPTGNKFGYFENEILYDQMKIAHHQTNVRAKLGSKLLSASKSQMIRFNPLQRLLESARYSAHLITSSTSTFQKLRSQRQLLHSHYADDVYKKKYKNKTNAQADGTPEALLGEEPENSLFPEWYKTFDYLNPPIIFDEKGEYIIPEEVQVESFPYQVYTLHHIDPPPEVDLGEAGNTRLKQLFKQELRDREVFQKSMQEYEAGFLPEDVLEKVVKRIKTRDADRKTEMVRIRDSLQENVVEQDRFRAMRVRSLYIQELQALERATQDHRVRLQDEKRVVMDQAQDVWLELPMNKVESRLFSYFRPNASEDELTRGRRLLQHFLEQDPSKGILPLFNQYSVKVRPIEGKTIIDPYHLLIDLQTYGKHAFDNQPIPTARLTNTFIDVAYPTTTINKKLWFPKTIEEAHQNRAQILARCPQYFEIRDRVIYRTKRRHEIRREAHLEKNSIFHRLKTFGKKIDEDVAEEVDRLKTEERVENDLAEYLEPGNYMTLNPLYEEAVKSGKEKEFDKYLDADYQPIKPLPELPWETPEYKAKRLATMHKIETNQRKRDQLKRFLWDKNRNDESKKLLVDSLPTFSRLRKASLAEINYYFKFNLTRLYKKLIRPPQWLLNALEQSPWLRSELESANEKQRIRELDEAAKREGKPLPSEETKLATFVQPYERVDEEMMVNKRFLGVSNNLNDTNLSSFPNNYTLDHLAQQLPIYDSPNASKSPATKVLSSTLNKITHKTVSMFTELAGGDPATHKEQFDPFILTMPNTHLRRHAQYWNATSQFNPAQNPYLSKVFITDDHRIVHEPVRDHPIVDDYKAIQAAIEKNQQMYGYDITKVNPQLAQDAIAHPTNFASAQFKSAASGIKMPMHPAGGPGPGKRYIPPSLEFATQRALMAHHIVMTNPHSNNLGLGYQHSSLNQTRRRRYHSQVRRGGEDDNNPGVMMNKNTNISFPLSTPQIRPITRIYKHRTHAERKLYIKQTTQRIMTFIQQPHLLTLFLHPLFAPFTLEHVRKNAQQSHYNTFTTTDSSQLPQHQFTSI